MEDPLAYPYPSFNIKEQVIHEQCRQLIANVAAFMKNEAELFKQTMQIIIPITSYKERVIAATGISEETYSKIVKEPEQVTTVISDSFPTQGVKRKHDNLEAFVKEHVNEVESVSPFHIKEEIMAPEQIVEDFEIETVPIAEPDIQIKDEVTTDLLKEEEICATSETVYVPSFQSEEALSTVNDLSSDVEEYANLATNDVIPQKSKERYDWTYKKFETWCELKKVTAVNEKVLLAYFESIKTLKSSTLWCTYSMLKTELKVKKNVDIKQYTTLTELLKRRSAGYHPKKSKILNRNDIETFLKEAQDKEFLFAKAAMIIGVAGACRKCELTFLRVKDVVDEDSFFKITVPETKTNAIREFVVTSGDIPGVNLMDIIRKYINMRPPITKHDRFFVNYRNEKCGVQPVGINSFGKLPQTIAQYLGLSNPFEYTGHCFRRSSASVLADSGADVLKIKRHGGWKSSNVAEGYVGTSLANKTLGESSKNVQMPT